MSSVIDISVVVVMLGLKEMLKTKGMKQTRLLARNKPTSN
jgi:hypothetical protein